MARTYSLKKSREILHWAYSRFTKTKDSLSPAKANALENDLRQLENAVFQGDRIQADKFSHSVEDFVQENCKKTPFQYAMEIIIAIAIALVIALIVRLMWFELYEIPTGSMRPSFKEQDHLTVSKTAFGLNVPFLTKHFLFEPDLVKRGGVVIFSGKNIALPDTDTKYFWIIPYKKSYVKRLIGKPGDTLYFYGGKIYGIDKEGNEIPELLDDAWMKKVDHVPFLSFEGDQPTLQNNQIIFKQMNMPVARYQVSPGGNVRGEVFNGKQWVKEEPFSKETKDEIQSYGSLWGFDNFAMARLLTREQLETLTPYKAKDVGEGVLYLELRHHPNLTYPAPKVTREGLMAKMASFTSVIPLQEQHLRAIMDNMYTLRFVIKNGKGYRYDAESSVLRGEGPKFPKVPDGTYEFYFGKADKIGWKGWASALPKDHPLYSYGPEQVQKLFNLGIDMDTRFAPGSPYQLSPRRYAYFFDGDLYLMGAPIIKKDDPVLAKYVQNEDKKAKESTQSRPYLPFKDKDGSPDKNTIQTFGVKVPDKHYLVLGDNYAMSSDSRVFGFVPEENLQGVPSFVLWPPGEGWGFPPQTGYQLITTPRLIVWGVALVCFLLWYILHRRRINTRLFKD